MGINLDVVIDSNDYSVDMNSGLETLRGASEATRQITTTILEERVPERLSSESKVRTNLKKTFKGSYGQEFSIDFYDDELERKFKGIGKKALVELISYFINEALCQDSLELSAKAQKILGKLDDELVEKLVKQLQISSLEHLHSVSNNFNQDVKLRFRQSREKQTTLTTINKSSYATLKPVTNKTKIKITASITRLNINTGNGRLLIKGETETVAFGFPAEKRYRDLKLASKKPFSKNLHANNGKSSDELETLELKVHTQRTRSGRIIKYIIEDIINAE